MFYLKKFLMKKILNKKKINKPFNYEKAENFKLSNDGDGTFNNSYYFTAHSYQKQQSFYVRLGLRDNGSAETWVFFCDKDETYILKEMIFTEETAPLKVFKTEKGWSFTFDGILEDKNGNKLKSTIKCDYFSDRDVIDFFQHMPTDRTATAIAQEKWSKQYFAEVQKNNSVHYEQEGNLNGEIIVGQKKFDIDLPCLRDHSLGRRVWGYMNNHIWIAGVDNDCALNFSMVSYPSMTALEVGHLHIKERHVEFVTKAHYDRNEIIKGIVPQSISLNLTIDKKRVIPVEVKLLHYTPYVFENGDYTLNEGIAELTIDGIKCRGILEIGFNGDSSRFMNGRVAKIKE